MGVTVDWLDGLALAAGLRADMRSKQVPTSTTSARRLNLLLGPSSGEVGAVSASGAPGAEGGGDAPEEEEPLGPGGPYACSQCRGAYPTRDQLERHETLHAPSTQTCKICHKSFANVYRLQRHMISHDESALLRKFKCNDCDKAFKFKHHLKEHLRIHSGEKPFECANCGKKFSHSGSYSSHMTSKKCLVMNLKMGRIKPNNPALNPDRSPSRKRASVIAAQLNNNLPHNGGAFLPILPKYNEAAAFFASMSQDNNFHRPHALQPGLHPFYMPHGMGMNPESVVTPYSFPTSLSQLFEQLASSQYQQRKVGQLMSPKPSSPLPTNPEDLIEEVTEEEDKRSDGSAELVMDIEEEEASALKKEQEDRETDLRSSSSHYESIALNNNGPEPDNNHSSFNTILESVSASVTKHFFRANIQKLSPVTGNICPRVEPPPSPQVVVKDDPDDFYRCAKCDATFNNKSDLLDHEKVLCGNFRKHEGLAAQVAETVALNRLEAEMRASIQSGASEDEDCIKEEREDKMSLQDTDRKIRVRTALSEEQQSVLKEHYAINPRPNREEFKKIAQLIGLDNRVVQVWFQNNRARERRQTQSAPADQPLDLSTKRSEPSVTSSPAPSPSPCSTPSDYEEAINLSHKSSRSPTPRTHYPHSNSSSSFTDSRLSPSPGAGEYTGHKRLLPKYPTSPMVPMEKLLQYSELYPRSPGEWGADDDPPRDHKRFKPDHDGQFICDQCDKTFVKQSSLARHKYEHSGQRPYKCVECPKAFKHKHHLTEHKRLHTGEKPFQCCKCLKKFSHSGSYSQHMNHRFAICKPYRD